jgi:hypothetical protein
MMNFVWNWTKTWEQDFHVLSNSPASGEPVQGEWTLSNSTWGVHSELRASCPVALGLSSLWARPASLSTLKLVFSWEIWSICLCYDCIMILWLLNGVYDYKLGLEWWIELWCCLYWLTMMIKYVEMRLWNYDNMIIVKWYVCLYVWP